MPQVTYIEFSGTHHIVEVSAGFSVMEGAVRNGVPGIDAECGGACACATCSVYIDEHWRDRVGEPSDMEEGMLEFAGRVEPGARLSCQIQVTEVMDGLVVHMTLAQR